MLNLQKAGDHSVLSLMLDLLGPQLVTVFLVHLRYPSLTLHRYNHSNKYLYSSSLVDVVFVSISVISIFCVCL